MAPAVHKSRNILFKCDVRPKRVLPGFGFIRKTDKLPEKECSMETKYFSLEMASSNKVTRVFQLVFGVTCIVVALTWVILNYYSIKANASLWATILFLLGFGYFMVVSGLGKAMKFIEISSDVIKIKRNSVLPASDLRADEIGRIEVFPLNIIFFLRSGKKIILRFGTTFTDVIGEVRLQIKDFSDLNNIPVEFKNEII